MTVAAFSVTADGNSVTIGDISVVRETNGTYKRYRLTELSPTITYGQAVIVSYTDPTTGDDTTAIEDAAGNDVASFTTGAGGVPAVINNLPPPVASTDATLSALALSGVTLSPAFDADTETYTASVANSVATTTVTAMATDADATVAVTPSTDADAVTSGHQVNLGVGPTTITATVTAEDGMTTKTYTVVVTRAAQTCTVPTGGIWGACLTAATISSGSTIDASLPDTGLGCISTSCGDTSVLTSRDFSFGGKNYRIDAVDLRGGTLEFNLQTAIGDTAAADFSSVVLHVGTLSYSLASASFVGNSEAFAWTNTGLSWSANDKVALQLVELASTNAPPAFSAATATRSVPENSPASTNVGAPVTATDGDNDPLAYSLEGTAATAFEIVSTSGQIRTTAGETYDRETQSSYAVTVKADDGNGGTDTIAVTITLTNVIEPPGRPAAPSVSSVAGSTTSLSVMWTAPANTGPAIDTYDLRYRQGTSGSWINSPQNVSGTSATISGLTANTLYQVQVLATSGDGGSPWSPSGSGQTNTAGNTAPTFSSPTASRSVPENSAAGTNVGAARHRDRRRQRRHADLHPGRHRRGLVRHRLDQWADPDQVGRDLRLRDEVELRGDREGRRRQRRQRHHHGDDHGDGRGRISVTRAGTGADAGPPAARAPAPRAGPDGRRGAGHTSAPARATRGVAARGGGPPAGWRSRPMPGGGRRGLTPRPPAPSVSHRQPFVPIVSRACDRVGGGTRVRVIAAPRAARRRPPPPVGRSPPSRPVASSPCPGAAAGRRERQSRAVAHGALPRGGVRDGVLHLWVLLAGAGLLWGDLPRDRATPPRAAGGRQASAQPGRPARSPGPPTGLPREMSPPRDSCTFPPPPSIPHHRTTRQARGHPARVPRVWARVGETSGLARATREIGPGGTTKGSRRWRFVTSRTWTGSRRVRWTPPRN